MNVCPPLILTGLLVALPAQQALFTGFGPSPYALTGDRVASGGDMDGDGRPDFLVSNPGVGQGRVDLVSGATGTARSLANPGSGGFANVLVGTPDMNLDGKADLVVDANGTLRAYSGSSLALLWQTPTAYFAAASVGDRDGDGRADLAALSSVSPGELRVLRGSDGSILSQYPLSLNGGTRLIAIGDITGDGVPELAWGSDNEIHVLRLANPPLLLTIGQPGRNLAAANFIGDPRAEILGGDSTNVRLFSATTGALLRTFPDVQGGEFALLGDLNADGVPDLALRRPAYLPGSVEACALVSGSNGALLADWPATAQIRCSRLAAAGDANGDGFGDFVIGDANGNATGPTSSPTGGWQLVSGRLLASMEQKPTACAQGPFFPQIGVTRPVLGQVATVAGLQAPAGTVGFVAFSLQPAIPTNLGVAGCNAWFDPNGGTLLQTTTTSSWQFGFAVPPAAQLAGVRIALQAFYVPTLTAIGLDVTNGIWATLGY